ncbi:MAG: cobalamin B12-binding domain-containing protein [Eubacteriales bacterium]|nr:cobalamin B12-binding domain-containing protein [Eubacteriales bacterium]
MKTLLVAINAKYAHTNLAVRSLQLALTGAGIPAEFAEYTINQPVRDILADIALQSPDRILFSCYIWNRAYVCALGEQLRLLFPDALLALGGPEASFDAEEQLKALPWADAIFCGEGEKLLPQVLREKTLAAFTAPKAASI